MGKGAADGKGEVAKEEAVLQGEEHAVEEQAVFLECDPVETIDLIDEVFVACDDDKWFCSANEEIYTVEVAGPDNFWSETDIYFDFLVDLGATSHAVNSQKLCGELSETIVPLRGIGGTIKTTRATGAAVSEFDNLVQIPLDHVLFSEHIPRNIWSVPTSLRSGWRYFSDLSGMAHPVHGVVRFKTEPNGLKYFRVILGTTADESFMGFFGSDEQTHEDCGHYPRDPHCDICARVHSRKRRHKRRRTCYPGKSNQETSWDTCGRVAVKSKRRWHFFTAGVDAFDHWRQVTGASTNNSEAAKNGLRTWCRRYRRPAQVRTDNGPEFFGAFESFAILHDIAIRRAVPREPQTNGLAEATIKKIVIIARALLLASHLGMEYWCYAVEVAVFILNRLPDAALGGESPYQRRFGKIPKTDFMRKFGEKCFFHLDASDKFAARFREGRFLGYDEDRSAYVVEDVITGRTYNRRSVKFPARLKRGAGLEIPYDNERVRRPYRRT